MTCRNRGSFRPSVGGGQTTEWVYGVTTGGGSTIASNDVVGKTKWPDPSTGSASTSEQETVTVNALGETLTTTDRNGSMHTLTRDVLGRVISDAVTTLGTGVDGSVRRIDTAYDSQGDPYLITSYDSASGGNIVNQIEQTYNGLGQLITEYQAVSGAVNTSTTPKVQYAYAEMPSGADQSRLTSVTYPSGYVLTSNYSSGINDAVSRLSSISDTTGTLESYKLLGVDTVVERNHDEESLTQTYISQTSSTGDGGDQYVGLDRFGRVVDDLWFTLSSGIPSVAVTVSELQYTYDRDSNTLTEENLVDSDFDQTFTYDSLNQLAGYTRGSSHSIDYDYDAIGNFLKVTTDGVEVDETANKQNEITSISGSTTPLYDFNGNMTTDQNNLTFIYDAWNRMVRVKSGSTVEETYTYDGLDRRVANTVGSTTTTMYYSARGQVLEETLGGSVSSQYVWSPVYVNAMILRNRATTTPGTLDERLWTLQDANGNVVGLVDGSQAVVERYTYEPYGKRTIYSATYATRSSSLYSMTHGFLGMRFDSISGMNVAGIRPYSPSLMRVTTSRSIELPSEDVNIYRFPGNSPITQFMQLSMVADWEVKWEWHHMFPKQFKEQFPNFDFDSIDNGFMLRGGDHRGAIDSLHSKDWNGDWKRWIKSQREPISFDAIAAQAEKMKNSDKYKDIFAGGMKATERHNVRLARLFKNRLLGWTKRVPGIGIGVAIFLWRSDIQAKGLAGGSANSVLDAVPGLSVVKGITEIFTGDWIPDENPNKYIPSIYPESYRHPTNPASPQHRSYESWQKRTIFSPTFGQFRRMDRIRCLPSTPPGR